MKWRTIGFLEEIRALFEPKAHAGEINILVRLKKRREEEKNVRKKKYKEEQPSRSLIEIERGVRNWEGKNRQKKLKLRKKSFSKKKKKDTGKEKKKERRTGAAQMTNQQIRLWVAAIREAVKSGQGRKKFKDRKLRRLPAKWRVGETKKRWKRERKHYQWGATNCAIGKFSSGTRSNPCKKAGKRV